MTRQFKASTKQGQNILKRASYNEGYFLSEVYVSYSPEKDRSWKWCEQQYLISDRHSNFRICSHNTFAYSVAWECYIGGERVTRVETPNNTYIVYLDK